MIPLHFHLAVLRTGKVLYSTSKSRFIPLPAFANKGRGGNFFRSIVFFYLCLKYIFFCSKKCENKQGFLNTIQTTCCLEFLNRISIWKNTVEYSDTRLVLFYVIFLDIQFVDGFFDFFLKSSLARNIMQISCFI